ncbi:MAG: M42 family metallopeptidase [Candidatus Cloacimonadota bacterium]|nr:M42 family metallopeptidase [Candidatus Cloacimonadota bacterium]
MKDQQLLTKLCLASGISGNEEQVREIMKKEVKNYDDVKYDKLGSVAFYLNGSSDLPKILVVAHMDEVGFVVADITNEGLIKLQPVGGWNPQTLLSSQLKIITNEGQEYLGTLGSTPPHFKDKSQKPQVVEIGEMFLDIGSSTLNEVIEYGISLGDSVVPDVNFINFKKSNKVMCKAFDDRVGVCAVVDILNHFSNNEHPNQLIGAGSVQEEVGARGAKTISQLVKPDLAIILEGAPADDIPGLRAHPQTKIGGGAHVRLWDPTMIVHNRYKKFILQVAEESGVKYQPTVRKGGGTDAKFIHLANIGIPSIVLGVPVRYAHSHRSIISLDDYDDLQELLKVIITKLDQKKFEEIVSVYS